MGGVGLLSWRIWSSAFSMSSQSRSLHTPASFNAVWVASSETALSACASSEKYRTTSCPFSSKGMPISGWLPERVKLEAMGSCVFVITEQLYHTIARIVGRNNLIYVYIYKYIY